MAKNLLTSKVRSGPQSRAREAASQFPPLRTTGGRAIKF